MYRKPSYIVSEHIKERLKGPLLSEDFEPNIFLFDDNHNYDTPRDRKKPPDGDKLLSKTRIIGHQ